MTNDRDAHDLLATDAALPPLRPDFLTAVREQGRRSVRRRRLGAGLVGVLLVAAAVPVVSGLTGGGDNTVLAVVTETPRAGNQRPASAAPEPPPEGELVTSQPTLPTEPADGFADIATSAKDAARAWERFGLDGAPPPVQQGTALLFRGLGESSGCPAEFLGLQVTVDQVRLTTGDGEQAVAASRACRADRRPRTLVVTVPLDALPEGAFLFDGFQLASTPLASPPPGPSVIDSWIADDPQVQVRSTPNTVVAGGRVEVLVTTGRFNVSPGSWTTLIERWEGQRWLPAVGADPYLDHPAASPARKQVSAGSSGPIAVIDTTGLPPGQYRVAARLGLGDAQGSTGVQAFFTVQS